MSGLVITSLEPGTIESTKDYPGFKYRVTSPYRLVCQDGSCVYTLEVPTDFLTDGATCAPDWGYAWVYHDWLYSTHSFKEGQECSRYVADTLFSKVCYASGYKWYGRMAKVIFKANPFYIISKAWTYSGRRGPVYAAETG